jgi:tetratricopeptide (TPR) repeat protein
MLQAAGRLAEALESYDKLTALDPGQAPAWVNKGVIYSQMEEPAKAATCLEKALELLPDHPIALFNFGLAKLKLSRYQEAADALRRFCAIAPRDYQKQVEHAEAMLNVIARTQVSTDRVEEWLGEADAFRAEGNWSKALEQYDKVLDANPKLWEAWLGKGTCLNGLRRFDEAVRCYDKILAEYPEDLQALVEKARSLDGATRYQDALAVIDTALEQSPHSAALLVQKGNTLGSLERHEEALQHFVHALEHEPDHPAARFFKAIAEEQLGIKEDALLSFEEFAARAPALLRQQHAYAQERIAKLRGS